MLESQRGVEIEVEKSRAEVGGVWKGDPQGGQVEQGHCCHPGAGTLSVEEPFAGGELTAFVLRSFVKAKSFIYIDPTIIEQSKTWLESKQQSNGCFQQSGKLFNNRMKGGVLDEVTLSAYITTALLEMNMSASLVLPEGLAKLSASPTTEDLGYASRIVRWLASQQNSYGGFSSTQDTVVALEALALYSTLVFSPDGSSTVTVQSPSGQLTFDVNQSNKLLYQERALQDVTGKYSLEVKGTACASMQMALRYNVPTPTDDSTFSILVKVEADCTSNSLRPKLTLKITFQYTGKEAMTNMVILDMKMLSGFVPDLESYKKLKRALLVDRVDQKEDRVLLYIQEVPSGIPINYSLELVQELPVQNLKAAVVKIYDYYQTSDQAETECIYPCAAGNNL
ncbi:murinoglobulin-2-like [Centroberyx gerrardi]